MLRRLLGLCLLFEDGQVEVGDEDGCVYSSRVNQSIDFCILC